MKKTADVIVIGGGIVGCASAYYLAKKGLSVIVLEADSCIGNGGSSRNGGGVRQSGRDPRELPLMMWGVKNIWPTLSEELGTDCEYVQKGNLRLGKNEKHKKILQGLTDKAVKEGLDVRMIDGNEVRKINPYLSDEVITASWCATDGHANPLTTTLGFYKKARELGADFITDVYVKELKTEKGKIRKVITSEETFEADKVLVAAGYESRAILNTVDIDIPMQHKKIECLVTEGEPKMFDQMLGTAEADFYGHQTKHGSFVFGGSTGLETFNEDNGTGISSSNLAPCICRGIMKYFPALQNANIVRSWAGFEDQSADGVAVIDAVDEIPGLYTTCAFTGHGFGIGPAAAYSIAEIMTGGKAPTDISGLTLNRFKAKI
jgi:sarcosine oxidase subunit beta